MIYQSAQVTVPGGTTRNFARHCAWRHTSARRYCKARRQLSGHRKIWRLWIWYNLRLDSHSPLIEPNWFSFRIVAVNSSYDRDIVPDKPSASYSHGGTQCPWLDRYSASPPCLRPRANHPGSSQTPTLSNAHHQSHIPITCTANPSSA